MFSKVKHSSLFLPERQKDKKMFYKTTSYLLQTANKHEPPHLLVVITIVVKK
jgi:hypothetical protein